MEYWKEKLPQKVEMMFQAVIDMLNEGIDINTMKVQDITNRAGIGKGTAYEYFQSKEELIGEAIDWNLRSAILGLRASVETKADFREKIYCILDFMGDKVKAQNNLMQMMGTSMNSCCITPGMKASLKKSGHPELIRRFLEDVMLSGIQEGVLNAEGSLYNRSTSLVSQLMMFLIYLKNEELQTKDSLETVKEQIYQNLLLLNH